MHARRAFTAVELAMAIGVMTILSGIAVPAVLPSLARGRVNQAAGAIEQVARQARLLAMTRLPAGDHYGVVVVNDGTQAYVALTRGATATPAQILTAADGTPVAKIAFNPNVVPWKDGQPLDGAVGFLFQYRTGFPVDAPSADAAPVSIGVAGSPVAAELGVRSRDGRYRTDLMVYQVGLLAREEKRVAGAP